MSTSTETLLNKLPNSQPHYPFITRLILELYLAGELPNLASLDIEPQYGYVARLVHNNGRVRFIRGKTLNINFTTSSEIARDKGYTKYFLQQLNYPTPEAKTFILPDYLVEIDRNLSRYGFMDYAEIAQIPTYINQQIGYPCFIKPNAGSQGKGVSKCFNDQDTQEVLELYQQQGFRVLIVEKAINFPDYRVVVLNEKVVSCYLRKPLVVLGDGLKTIRELLLDRQESFVKRGREVLIQLDDPRIFKQAALFGYTLDTILPEGSSFQVYAASNLSLGGESEDYTSRIHSHWKDLAIRLAHDMGLLFCGVDLACADIEDPTAEYSILEINSAPGMDNYAASGEEQSQIVRAIYREIFNEVIFLSK